MQRLLPCEGALLADCRPTANPNLLLVKVRSETKRTVKGRFNPTLSVRSGLSYYS